MSPDENKTIVLRYFEEVHNQRKLTVMDEIFTPDLGESTKKAIAMIVTGFPDYHISIKDQIAEADKVVTVWTIKGGNCLDH